MHVVRSAEAESDDEAVPQPAPYLCRCFISKRDKRVIMLMPDTCVRYWREIDAHEAMSAVERTTTCPPVSRTACAPRDDHLKLRASK